MATEIKCPKCGNIFEPNEAIREEVEKELRSKAADWQKKKNEEFLVKLEDRGGRIRLELPLARLEFGSPRGEEPRRSIA